MSAEHQPGQFTLGIEEELHLVDLRTRQLTPRAAEPTGVNECRH
jgi:gamma-glutamyl:cysteine ligase YbdK (ATP-grasp superfamily)